MASQTSLDLTQLMYVAYYGRPADPGGLTFWADSFDASADLTAQLAEFGNSQEFIDGFGTLSSSELINGLYQQLFNRDADSGGLSFYTDLLSSGAATLASIAKDIAVGALGSDKTLIDNKVAVANYFTEQVAASGFQYSSEDIPAAQQLLSRVSESASAVSNGQQAADLFVSDQHLVLSQEGTSSAASADFLLHFLEGNYEYRISDFRSGDLLSFNNTNQPTVENTSGSDGTLVIYSASSEGLVTVTLTGIPVTLDNQIFNTTSFNTAFGDGSLAWG